MQFGFICAHTLAGFPDLNDIDLDEYQEIVLRNDYCRCVYEMPELAFSGVNGKGVLTYSQALYEGQVAELNKSIQSFQDSCTEIAASLGHPRGKYTQMIRKARKEHEAEVLQVEKNNRDVEKKCQEKQAKGNIVRGRQKKLKELPVWDEETVAAQLVPEAALKGRRNLSSFVEVSALIPSGSDSMPLLYRPDEAFCGRHSFDIY